MCTAGSVVADVLMAFTHYTFLVVVLWGGLNNDYAIILLDFYLEGDNMFACCCFF